MKNLLLLSNSTNYGEQYMQWCKSVIAYFVSEHTGSIVFIPYAAVDFTYQAYTDKVNQALQEFGITVTNLDSCTDKKQALQDASAIFVGGGNTFHLLKQLQDLDLIETIQQEVHAGTRYAGWSAGSNIAAQTICTTNDMPIVQPNSFNALGLIDYQINPHYTEQVIENHGGESRKKRLREYLAANKNQQVICLPEGTYLEVNNNRLTYIGEEEGKLLAFEKEIVLSNSFTL